MTTWFHFTPGDTLWFQSWIVSSPAKLFGACLGLFVIAVLERWLAATRIVLEGRWVVEDQALAQNAPLPPLMPPPGFVDEKTKAKASSPKDAAGKDKSMLRRPFPRTTTRTTPPFVWKRDLLRGLIYVVQLVIAFAVMLVIMTFQLSFIFSLVLGAGIGEVIFGRYASAALGSHGLH